MATKIREIPRKHWTRFLDDFTREHQGWQVRVEVESPEAGPIVEAHDLPLQGIAADHRAGERDVAIIVGEEENPALTRIVHQARGLRVHQTEAGNIAGIEIESAGGERTFLRLLQVPQAA